MSNFCSSVGRPIFKLFSSMNKNFFWNFDDIITRTDIFRLYLVGSKAKGVINKESFSTSFFNVICLCTTLVQTQWIFNLQISAQSTVTCYSLTDISCKHLEQEFLNAIHFIFELKIGLFKVTGIKFMFKMHQIKFVSILIFY